MMLSHSRVEIYSISLPFKLRENINRTLSQRKSLHFLFTKLLLPKNQTFLHKSRVYSNKKLYSIRPLAEPAAKYRWDMSHYE